MGFGQYGQSDWEKQVLGVLELFPKRRPAALLLYMVEYMPDTWHAFSLGRYGVIIEDTDVKVVTQSPCG